jgi:cellulose synthase/poly-beta-1,6-N-acetylglucosamine synthase-like glycosyltransferase
VFETRIVIAVDIALLILAVIVALPCLIFFIECAAALLPPIERATTSPDAGAPRVAVLVPAHDEQSLIAETLAGLKPELADPRSIIVVADNCTDRTAEIARSQGATVIERNDPDRRGKGYALEFGIAHLTRDPPEVVLIVDADCQVEPGSIQRLARFSLLHGRPAQADYLMTPPEGVSSKGSVSALAFLVKNRVRPRGLARLGLPCHLTGTGMAFPWKVLKAAPPTGSHLVEDMLMGIELTALGFAPIHCVDAHVTSMAPERDEATRGQRRRWEHGALSMLVQRGPQLVLRGLRERRLYHLTMGLDLMVPPLALLVTVLTLGVVVSLAWALWGGGSSAPFLVFGTALAAVALAVVLVWFKFGRTILSARQLLAIPFYVLWKVPVYLAWILRGRHQRWERTERTPKS